LVKAISDDRIRFMPSTSNTGRAAAADRGFACARGSYVAVLDADDTMDPERLAKQVGFLDAHPDVGACGSAARIIGRASHVAHWPLTDEACRAKMLFEDPMLYGSAMFRRSMLEASGVRCDVTWTTPGMDYLFQVALSAHTSFANLPEALTAYRIHSSNMRHGRDEWADKRLIQHRVFELLGIKAEEQNVIDHLQFFRLFRTAPDRASIIRLRQWADHLVAWNAQHRKFPEPAFSAAVEERWNHVFHVLPDRSTSAAIQHIRSAPHFRMDHVIYALKVRIRKAFGVAR